MKSCNRNKHRHTHTDQQYRPYGIKRNNVVNYNITQNYLSVDILDFDILNVSFSETHENKVVNGTFSNIIYTDSNVIFNGIFILLSDIYSKAYKLDYIERIVLQWYTEFSATSKEPLYLVKEDIENTEKKMVFDNNYIFKISGVWETDTHYGINYRFIQRK